VHHASDRAEHFVAACAEVEVSDDVETVKAHRTVKFAERLRLREPETPCFFGFGEGDCWKIDPMHCFRGRTLNPPGHAIATRHQIEHRT
jgi:hypothetical protein